MARLRCIRIFLSVALALMALCALGAWWYISESLASLKPTIEKMLGDALGAQVAVGSVRPQVFPSIAIDVREVEVSRGPRCQAIASIGSAELRMQLSNLLAGNFSIDLVRFETPVFSLHWGDNGLLDAKGFSCDLPAEASPLEQAASSPLRFNIQHLEIVDGQGSIRYLGRTHAVSIKQAAADIALQEGRFAIERATISGAYNDLRFSIDGQGVQATSSGDLDVRSATITAEGLSATFSAVEVRSGALKSAALGVKGANLGKLNQSYKLKLPIAPASGVFSAEAKVEARSDGTMAVSGTAQLSNAELASPRMRAKNLRFKNTLATFSKGALSNLSSVVDLEEASIVDRSDSYGLRNATIEVKSGPTQKSSQHYSGNATVKGFSFRDGDVDLHDVDAALTNIKVTYSPRTGVEAALTLDGTSVKLQGPAVEVAGLGRVSAPLTISILNGGGYRVAGPVTVTSANIVTEGRPFEDVSGTVSILISGPKKAFAAQNLRAAFKGHEVKAAAHFSMTPDSYSAGPSSIKLSGGNLQIAGSISRSVARTFSVKASGAKLPLTAVVPLLIPEASDVPTGVLQSVELVLLGDRSRFPQSLRGSGSATVSEPLLEGASLTQRISSAVSSIPGVTGNLSSKLDDAPAKAPAVEAKVEVADGLMQVRELILRRKDYTVYGEGTVDFEKMVNAKARVVFLQETMSALGGGFEPLRRLLGRAGRVSIPILLEGKLPDVAIKPNMPLLAKQLSGLSLAEDALSATSAAGQEVLGILTSPFTGKRTSTPTPTQRVIVTVGAEPTPVTKGRTNVAMPPAR